LTDIREKLEKSRAYFSKANASEKDALSSEIIEAEQQELQLSAEIRQLTKLIRKNENKIINHK